MRLTGQPPSRASEEGFTLLEVLIGMAILSILGIGVWMAVTVSLRTAERFHAGALASAVLLQVDDRLRDGARRIRPPWWSVGSALHVREYGWTIPFEDGNPEESLDITFKDGVLSVADGTLLSQFHGFTAVALTPALDADGREIGLSLTVEGRFSGKVTITARYGGAPVSGVGGSP